VRAEPLQESAVTEAEDALTTDPVLHTEDFDEHWKGVLESRVEVVRSPDENGTCWVHAAGCLVPRGAVESLRVLHAARTQRGLPAQCCLDKTLSTLVMLVHKLRHLRWDADVLSATSLGTARAWAEGVERDHPGLEVLTREVLELTEVQAGLTTRWLGQHAWDVMLAVSALGELRKADRVSTTQVDAARTALLDPQGSAAGLAKADGGAEVWAVAGELASRPGPGWLVLAHGGLLSGWSLDGLSSLDLELEALEVLGLGGEVVILPAALEGLLRWGKGHQAVRLEASDDDEVLETAKRLVRDGLEPWEALESARALR
jgi:hypothetical protein